MGRYSKEKINKETLKGSLESPVTLFSLGISFLAGVTSFLFGSGFILNTIMYAGLGIGLGSWLINYFLRKDHFASEYLKALEKQLNEQNDKMLAKIKHEFQESDLSEDTRVYGDQGYEQFERIQDKFETISDILEKKFNPGELTHRRFLASAEEVYLSVLDNLNEIASMLNTTEAIDASYIDKRLEYFKTKEDINADDQKEIDSLNKRKSIKSKQIEHINKLLSTNEQAMTSLDETMTSIASVKTKQGASQDIEQTIGQLERLAKSAKKYEL